MSEFYLKEIDTVFYVGVALHITDPECKPRQSIRIHITEPGIDCSVKDVESIIDRLSAAISIVKAYDIVPDVPEPPPPPPCNVMKQTDTKPRNQKELDEWQ